MAAKKKATTKRTATKPAEVDTSDRVGQSIKIAKDLDALRKVDPGQWRDKIVQAFRVNEGKALQVATHLGIGHRTLLRYMKDDESLSLAIEKIRVTARKQRHEDQKRKRKERRDAKRAGSKVTTAAEATA